MIPKIAYFIDTDSFGGAEVLTVEICSEIKSRGYHPVIIHFGNSQISSRCKTLEIDEVLCPKWSSYKSTRTLPIFAVKFAQLLKAQGIDLLHSHLYGPTIAGALAARLIGIPHIGTLHDTYIVEERPIRVRFLQMSSLLGTRLVCVSDLMRQRFSDMCWFPPSRISTIHNGVKPLAPDVTMRKTVREKLGIESGDVVFICVARFEQLKRHNELVRTFALARKTAAKTVKLLLLGTGHELEQIRNLTVELDLKEHVLLLGEQDDVPSYLLASDVFVLWSSTEGLSRSILEAMAAGLPVIASDVGGNSELLANNVSGYLVPADHPQELHSKMAFLASDESLRGEIGENARLRCHDFFSFNKMIDLYGTLYSNLLAS